MIKEKIKKHKGNYMFMDYSIEIWYHVEDNVQSIMVETEVFHQYFKYNNTVEIENDNIQSQIDIAIKCNLTVIYTFIDKYNNENNIHINNIDYIKAAVKDLFKRNGKNY